MWSCSSPSMIAFVLLAGALAGQQDVYVDPVNGNNGNDGSLANPLQTVDYALNGPHSPLQNGSTLHLMGTSGLRYSAASGEVFPWVVYGRLNLIAGPDGSGSVIEVDSGATHAVEYLASRDSAQAELRGVDFVSATAPLAVLVGGAAGKVHSPRIEDCDLSLSAPGADGVRIAGAAGSTAGTELRGCTISVPDTGVELLLQGHSRMVVVVDDNTITAATAVRAQGLAVNGELRVTANQLTSTGDCLVLDGLDRPAVVEGNDLGQAGPPVGRGLLVRQCSWGSGASFRDNDCSGFAAGVEVEGTPGVAVLDSLFDGNDDGLLLAAPGGDGLRFEGNTVRCAPGGGGRGVALLAPASEVELRGNQIEDAVTGILAGDPGLTGLEVVGNQLLRSAVDGIEVVGAAGLLIEGNTVRDGGGDGLDLRGSSGNTIATNRILANLGHGVYDELSLGGRFMSNLVAGNGGDGLHLAGAASIDPPRVAGNTFADNLGYGLHSALGAALPPYLSSSILWGNNGAGDDFLGPALGQYWYCVIEHGAAPGYGNLSADPQLDPISYAIGPSSSAVDAGSLDLIDWRADLDGDSRVLDGDWIGGAVPDIGADELSDTQLSLSGTVAPGATIQFDLQSLPGLEVRLYVALHPSAWPLADDLGTLHPYGNFQLLLSQLHGGGAFAIGSTDAAGAWSKQVQIPPNPNLIGWKVGLQAWVSASPSSGQFSNCLATVIEG